MYESLVATAETISSKVAESSTSSLIGPQLEPDELGSGSCALLVVKPIRQSLQNWSGAEDIMKVKVAWK